MNFDRIVERLKKDEGFSPVSFWDNDQWTYGYGTVAPGKGAQITREQAEVALRDRVTLAIYDYKLLFGDMPIDDVRAEALVNMLFNLGRTKLSKFKKMLGAIYRGEWGTVAYEAHDSLWFKQLSKQGNEKLERAERIVWELLTGEEV